MTTLTTSTEILDALYSVSMEDWKVEDTVYLNDLDTDAIKYHHVEGYFYSDNFNEYWIADPNDFETDDEGYTSMPNAIWLRQR